MFDCCQAPCPIHVLVLVSTFDLSWNTRQLDSLSEQPTTKVKDVTLNTKLHLSLRDSLSKLEWFTVAWGWSIIVTLATIQQPMSICLLVCLSVQESQPFLDCLNTSERELCYISKADLFLGHPVLNARIPLFDTGTMWCETGSSLINKVIVNVQFILHLVCVGKLASLDIEWISFKLHLTFIDKMKLQESEILYKRLYFIIF